LCDRKVEVSLSRFRQSRCHGSIEGCCPAGLLGSQAFPGRLVGVTVKRPPDGEADNDDEQNAE
jgi:hypothetical protein